MLDRRLIAIALGLIVALFAAPAIAGDPTPQRQGELLHQLRQECGSCHGAALEGGLGPGLLPEYVEEMSIAELAAIIRHGIAGTPMHGAALKLDRDEALWLANQLQKGLPANK